MKKERLFKSDMITHTKPNHKRLNFSFCWLNPLPLEAERLNCGKVAIFKLDILVISEERTNVTKLTSIRLLSPCCLTVAPAEKKLLGWTSASMTVQGTFWGGGDPNPNPKMKTYSQCQIRK